jgi:DNA-directed RNA polymerase subunit M/transcription elongation factor TFIIS
MSDLAELACPRCAFASVCGPSSMLDWLRQVKMVRRDVQPEPELLGELFRSAAAKFTCPECGMLGLVVRPAPEENDEEWGMARACEDCGRPVARQRLEVFPDAKLCVECQARSDRGETTGAKEYCPRCGNLMVVRKTRGPGVTRYVLACPKCRS